VTWHLPSDDLDPLYEGCWSGQYQAGVSGHGDYEGSDWAILAALIAGLTDLTTMAELAKGLLCTKEPKVSVGAEGVGLRPSAALARVAARAHRLPG